MPPPVSELTELVERWGAGDREAFDRIVALLYDDLRDLARSHLRRERDGHTLDTTALVHEAWVQVAAKTGPEWRGRAAFFGFLSSVMRHVLVDYARRRGAAKRGGDAVRVTLQTSSAAETPISWDLLALDEALTRLSELDPELAAVVEHRFFGGLTADDIAEATGVSVRTVERRWQRARAHLYRLLATGSGAEA